MFVQRMHLGYISVQAYHSEIVLDVWHIFEEICT